MLRRTVPSLAGISAANVYIPPCKVDLKHWCEWTGNNYTKISEVVGESFRVCTMKENAYTMAATSVLRLILENDIDPQQVGMLALGTESSTDNSAGSVIIRGMVDHALEEMNMPPLSRNCEVHESKMACLGMLNCAISALRAVETDLADRLAIVVASDIAEYQQGSTGEQTSGAGACSWLIERKPKMLELDFRKMGSASRYRGADFRKGHARHFTPGYPTHHESRVSDKVNDFPVFSGPYSTVCYVDCVTQAVEDMLKKVHLRKHEMFDRSSLILSHRPYGYMPVTSLSVLYTRALARAESQEHKMKFAELCDKAKVKPADVVSELDVSPDFFRILEETGKVPNVTPNIDAVAKHLRRDADFLKVVQSKMSLGSSAAANFGNLYTGSLPAWISAALEEAATTGVQLQGSNIIAVGFGSGSASLAIPATVVSGWEKPAKKIGIAKLFDSPLLELSKEQYDGLHSGTETKDIAADKRHMEFLIDRVGTRHEPAFQDVGVEYYKFIR